MSNETEETNGTVERAASLSPQAWTTSGARVAVGNDSNGTPKVLVIAAADADRSAIDAAVATIRPPTAENAEPDGPNRVQLRAGQTVVSVMWSTEGEALRWPLGGERSTPSPEAAVTSVTDTTAGTPAAPAVTTMAPTDQATPVPAVAVAEVAPRTEQAPTAPAADGARDAVWRLCTDLAYVLSLPKKELARVLVSDRVTRELAGRIVGRAMISTVARLSAATGPTRWAGEYAWVQQKLAERAGK